MKDIKQLVQPITPFLILFLVLLASCEENAFDLDESPRDRVSAEQVFQSEAFADALVADLYVQFPYTGFDSYDGKIGDHDLGTQRGSGYTSCFTHGGMSSTNDCEGLWDYEFIRDMNSYIDNIRASELSESYKRKVEGEVRVLRAAVYLKMQQRYGGVPLVDVVLDPFEEIGDEYRLRSSEEALANFIDSELAAAADMLTGLGDTGATGRVNEYTALAYKARANLWAASIAKFGILAANGYTGIPASRADEFYGKARDAAAEVINSGTYALKQGGDMELNFWSILTEDSHGEIIFEKIYNGNEIDHSFAHLNQPTPFSEGQGSQMNPTLELINMFENLDGTFSAPVIGAGTLYPTGRGPWQNKDPRTYAVALFQGDIYGGNVIELYEGIDPTVGSTDENAIVSEAGMFVNGKESVGTASRKQENHFFPSTGFLLRKYVPNTPLVPSGTESNNWKELRLGELYLVAAESEFELGNLTEAATWLNFTRNRVGLMNIEATPGGITQDRVRTERAAELVYEGFRWGDIRRWRTAQALLDGQDVSGVRPIYHDETGQYYFLPLDAESVTRTFRPEHYYNPITQDRIENQAELEENPGY